MPTEIRVVGQKFFYENRNGTSFNQNLSYYTNHLKGNVLEKVKAVFNVQVSWYVEFLSDKDVGYFYNNVEDTVIINSVSGDFINNGFSIGDEFKFTSSGFWIKGTITAISDTEVVADVTAVSSVPNPNQWFYPDGEQIMTGTTKKTALKYKFGLIENNESVNFLSKLTNTEQTYVYQGIDHDTFNTVNGKSLGNNKAWQTGESTCRFVGYSVDKNKFLTEETTQEFEITHEFIITPFYREDEIDSLKGEDIPPIDIFNGNKSLKYVFETEFRTTLNNPNTSMISQYDTQEGSVGYFNESYNGYENIFSVESLTYSVGGNSATRLDAGEVTTCTSVIKSSDGVEFQNGGIISVGHSAIIDADVYSNNKDNYNTIWVDETARAPIGGSFVGDILNVTSVVLDAVDTITITFEVDLSGKNVADNQDYVLYFVVEDWTASIAAESQKVTLLSDVNQYYKNSDINGLWNNIKFEQYPHAEPFEEGVTSGFTNAKGFNETGYFLDSNFTKDDTAELTDLSFEFIIFNNVTQDIYTLRTFDFDLSSSLLVGNSQQITLDSNRGYVLKDSDLLNIVKIQSGDSVGGFTPYDIRVGYKTPWQEWNEFKNAPTEFFDRTQPNNGLNEKTSNYSLNIAYFEPRVILRANLLKDGINTEYVTSSEPFEVYDYQEDDQDPDAFTCNIGTYNSEGDSIEGNLIKRDFTELKAFFTPTTPPTFTTPVDMTEVSTVWNRFAHGNKWDVFTFVRLPNWLNDQADDVDYFTDFGATPQFTKNEPTLYTSTTNQILANNNMGAVYGCYSPERYEYYEIGGTMFSTSVDDDVIKYDICFEVDDEGIEHCLSLCVSAGGVTISEINPDYDPNDISTQPFYFSTDPNDQMAQCAIIYNYGRGNMQVLDFFKTTAVKDAWANQGECLFNVQRSSDLIECSIDWTIKGAQFTNTFNIDLADQNHTDVFPLFKGYNHIGFSFYSQDQGGFKDVNLTQAGGDFYGILRIESENASTDFNISELSTVNEAPEDNLLKQITGDEKKATISWDGTSFVIQGLVETDKIEEGEKYKLSAEIRQLNLTE